MDGPYRMAKECKDIYVPLGVCTIVEDHHNRVDRMTYLVDVRHSLSLKWLV
jgi:hypothetical protein